MPPTQYIISGKVAPPPNSRDALFSLLQGADPLDPKAPQGPPPPPPPRGPQGAQGPREPKGTQGKGPGGTRDPRAPSAPLGGDGPFGVIPKPFRMEGHFEWKVILVCTLRFGTYRTPGRPCKISGTSMGISLKWPKTWALSRPCGRLP